MTIDISPSISSQTIRILIADDHPIVRDGLAAVLNVQPAMAVVAQASNGREAVDCFYRYQPDVTIVDLRMPEMGGVEAISTIRAEFPHACFIMLTIYDGDEDIYQGFRAGAKAYLLKDAPCEEIIKTIRIVHQGHRYVPSDIALKLSERIETTVLTQREQQVLQLLVNGNGNSEIMASLGISEGTVKFHINNILSKLNVSDRTQAVIVALKRGLARLNP